MFLAVPILVDAEKRMFTHFHLHFFTKKLFYFKQLICFSVTTLLKAFYTRMSALRYSCNKFCKSASSCKASARARNVADCSLRACLST